MYTCEHICNFIADYIDNELPEEEHKLFEQHIRMCWPCQEYMKSYKQTVSLARNCKKTDPKPEQVPEALIHAILDSAPRIMAEAQKKTNQKNKECASMKIQMNQPKIAQEHPQQDSATDTK